MFPSKRSLRHYFSFATTLLALLCLWQCSGLTGSGGAGGGGVGGNPVGGPNAATGGQESTGGDTNQVPPTQPAQGSIPGPSVISYQVEVKVISGGQSVPCRPDPISPPLTNAVLCNEATEFTDSKSLRTRGACDPEPSPIVVPNAPKVTFNFVPSGGDSTTKIVDALCFANGSWKTEGLLFRSIPPNTGKAQATYNFNGQNYSSALVTAPQDSEMIPTPVTVIIDLDSAIVNTNATSALAE